MALCQAKAVIEVDAGRGGVAPMAVVECGKEAGEDHNEWHACVVANSTPQIIIHWKDESS